uniref:Putative LOC101163551 [Oryzias latipes] n=1 Tax=Lepeophtheirus salmonis TaxID=72036 RepID=A0A0K2U7L4_LEPSM
MDTLMVKNPTWSNKVHRYFAEVSEYGVTLRHISGNDNIPADFLP